MQAMLLAVITFGSIAVGAAINMEVIGATGVQHAIGFFSGVVAMLPVLIASND